MDECPLCHGTLWITCDGAECELCHAVPGGLHQMVCTDPFGVHQPGDRAVPGHHALVAGDGLRAVYSYPAALTDEQQDDVLRLLERR